MLNSLVYNFYVHNRFFYFLHLFLQVRNTIYYVVSNNTANNKTLNSLVCKF